MMKNRQDKTRIDRTESTIRQEKQDRQEHE